MKPQKKADSLPRPSEDSPLSVVVESIIAEFKITMGSPERVKSACDQLRERLGRPPTSSELDQVRRLLPLLGKRVGAITLLLFDLMEEISMAVPEPWPLVMGLLAARDPGTAIRALSLASLLVESGSLLVDFQVARFLVQAVEKNGSPLAKPESLAEVGRIISQLSWPGHRDREDPLEALYLQEEDTGLRRLAARLMDLEGRPVSEDSARQILGREAYQFLAPYLAFTRASHLDLLSLVERPGVPPPCLPSFKKTESLCGARLLREVVAELGWSSVNLGVEAHQYVSIRIGHSFPILVSPTEASLFDSIKEGSREGDFYLFVAHGRTLVKGRGSAGGDEAIDRFRSYNMTHSELLADILSFAPLTAKRVWRILDRMDRIVADFVALFSSHTDEGSSLPEVYQMLRQQVLSELKKEGSEGQASGELTRLVQTFEDPKTIGEARSFHGLKRYLHQRGLRLGIHLADPGQATDTAVSLMAVFANGSMKVARRISYVVFGPADENTEEMRIPYPVRIVADGFARQILHKQENLPDVRIFCYANEVHYYVTFINHPAFLRIDYSPPLQGGMIDLEYYGVSKKELESHPNLSLDAVQYFFRQLEFEVQVKNTRVHARYDKERALDLGDLCERAETLFCLIPYLMEVDWVIGSLDLPAEARKAVAAGWARFFSLWGVLPIRQILTHDRLGILVSLDPGPTGDREVVWSGTAPYRDGVSEEIPFDIFMKLQSLLLDLSAEIVPIPDKCGLRPIGQIQIENLLLRPLRNAMERGEIVQTGEDLQPAPRELFHRQSEVEFFAEMLSSGNRGIASSASLAQLVAHLEQTLQFQTTGSLNGYDVQRAPLPLCGGGLSLYVLRDDRGIIRLAMFALGETLFLSRENPALPWRSNASVNAFQLAKLLRLNNYYLPGMVSPLEKDREKPETIRSKFRRMSPRRRRHQIPGERVLEGVRASPGRAVGRVLFGTKGRVPEDFDRYILVAPSIRPEDSPYLHHSKGVISTGGGILSHTGLIAVQLGKPALIIPGQWFGGTDGSPTLLYCTFHYQEKDKEIQGYRVSIWSDMHRQEHVLNEGDLVILDAEKGTLSILGQDLQALTFHENMHNLSEATRRLAQATDEKGILILRGRRLRSLHQIEKLLSRLTDPRMARHVLDEILLSEDLSSHGGGQSEKVRLLSLVLGNQTVGEIAHNYLLEIFYDLKERHRVLLEGFQQEIPSAAYPIEILFPRLQLLHLRQTLKGVFESLLNCGIEAISMDSSIENDIDPNARGRLKTLRTRLAEELEREVPAGEITFGLRHLVRQLDRVDQVLQTPSIHQEPVARLSAKIIGEDKAARARLEMRRLLGPEDGGLELFPLIGWKAANLAEVERIGGRGLVPPWFVVTDKAFQEVLDSPIDNIAKDLCGTAGANSMREGIDAVLLRGDLDNLRKSRLIQQLWDVVRVPQELTQDVLEAYRRFQESVPEGAVVEQGGSEAFVAVRSSALEEDAELAAGAGEFETFLFIRGEELLLNYLKKAWAGLWTERAIHNRKILGSGQDTLRGGVIVQRNVASRVSGVLQTVHVAEGNLREMVINAGLGLGEGVVSGMVSADQIVVAKEGILEGALLRLRYVTNDKREQVVFDARRGLGTTTSQTLHHQRFRPALEFVEIQEVVVASARLEAVYGYPLDIEFAVEGNRLWILQARPVPIFLTTLHETMKHYPMSLQKESVSDSQGKEIML
ncbi:MAG: PEP/pyruvate-binding domain-containing protein [Pseudomonadota bacterium]